MCLWFCKPLAKKVFGPFNLFINFLRCEEYFLLVLIDSLKKNFTQGAININSWFKIQLKFILKLLISFSLLRLQKIIKTSSKKHTESL